MSFIRNSAKIVEHKIEQFKKDIENEVSMEKKILKLFKNEFEETLPDILLIKEVQFIDQIKNGVLLVLENIYTDYCLTNDKIKNVLENGLNKIKNDYKNTYALLCESWEEYEKNTKKRIGDNKFETLTNFRKHCFGSEDFASHNCHNKQNRFIIIKNKNNEKVFAICQACKKVYYTSFIKCHCKKCNVDFYTNLLNNSEDSTLFQATWEHYHCPQILNEEMKCINCQGQFMINMKTGMLCCSNKKCNFTANPMNILWSCSLCNKEFRSKAIPYNPLEIILIKKIIRHTLLLKHRAHPNKLPCCDINVYFTDFYHKKICRGILFEGELNDKMIVVCEKCHAVNFHERFIWTCPKCGKKFRDKINLLTEEEFEKNNNRGTNPEIQIESKKKEQTDDMWEKVKKNSLKAVIDSPIKKNNTKNYRGVYDMLMARKEYLEEDVLANFRKNAINSSRNYPVDKYEGNDIYEDRIDRKKTDYIKYRKKEIEMKSPIKSPKKTQIQSPKKSPYKSPQKSPSKSPIKSPRKISQKNQERSPNRISLNFEEDNNKNIKSEKEDDTTIDNDNDDDSIVEIEENEEIENNIQNLKKSIKRSIKEKTRGKEINDNKEKEENKVQKIIPMNKVPGISEHLMNHINKRVNNILSKIKIPLINIDDYSFNRKLGEGSYGIIYSVMSNIDKKNYAIKKIIARSLGEIEDFTKEFELVFSCNHPNIMKIYGLSLTILDSTTFALYVLMEMANNDWDKEIKSRLKKRKNYTEKELINILRELTDALLFMQKELKISHRDIKPQNILVFSNGIYKLADFGEAKEVKISKRLNTLRGTELYMSPALYEGLKKGKNDVPHDPFKSDVYSLGFCMLYASSLNFDLLYEARDYNSSDMINMILNKSFIKKIYSDNLITILSNMLLIDEKKRFSFQELLNFIDKNYGKK